MGPGGTVSSSGPLRSLLALPGLWDLHLELQVRVHCAPEPMPSPFGTLAFSALTHAPTQVQEIPGAPAALGQWGARCHLRPVSASLHHSAIADLPRGLLDLQRTCQEFYTASREKAQVSLPGNLLGFLWSQPHTDIPIHMRFKGQEVAPQGQDSQAWSEY